MNFLKFNQYFVSEDDDGTFWPGVIEVPSESEIFTEEKTSTSFIKNNPRLITGLFLFIIDLLDVQFYFELQHYLNILETLDNDTVEVKINIFEGDKVIIERINIVAYGGGTKFIDVQPANDYIPDFTNFHYYCMTWDNSEKQVSWYRDGALFQQQTEGNGGGSYGYVGDYARSSSQLYPSHSGISAANNVVVGAIGSNILARFSYDSTTVTFNSSLTTNGGDMSTWFHVLILRQSNKWYTFVDGVLDGYYAETSARDIDNGGGFHFGTIDRSCLLYTSPSPRDS